MDKKCQVFVSSTYLDLKEERQEVVQIILRQGHIPAGMELFGQDDRRQWEVITEWIRNSDIVLLMIKNRYGTICKDTGKSYTQMEYELATKLGKPIIRIVFNQDSNCEKDEKLARFRAEVMEDRVVTPINSMIEMAERITRQLNEYSEGLREGWVRYQGNLPEQHPIETGENHYKLMQYLMFAEDTNSIGFNRFMVAPKIMMLLDMKQDYNPVSIGHLTARYSIIQNAEYTDDIYDCEREWRLDNVHNDGNCDMRTYSFYTSTDIGKRYDSEIELRNCINEGKQKLDDSTYKNNGISRWRWELQPSVEGNGYLNDMSISEKVKKAWDFNRYPEQEERNPEIIYFIPKCFGFCITRLSFIVDVYAPKSHFAMELFEIIRTANGYARRSVGILHENCVGEESKFCIEMGPTEINMESLYYIKIRKMY